MQVGIHNEEDMALQPNIGIMCLLGSSGPSIVPHIERYWEWQHGAFSLVWGCMTSLTLSLVGTGTIEVTRQAGKQAWTHFCRPAGALSELVL